jgi:hypothetical protein
MATRPRRGAATTTFRAGFTPDLQVSHVEEESHHEVRRGLSVSQVICVCHGHC